MVKKEFSEYLTRDKRRWKYADIDENNVLNLEEFHMFSRPLKYAEMMDVVAVVSLIKNEIISTLFNLILRPFYLFLINCSSQLKTSYNKMKMMKTIDEP